MFGRLNHVALAVPDLNAAVSRYRALGARVSEPQSLPEHGVTVVFIQADNTKIELLHPLGENSPIAAFLERQSRSFPASEGYGRGALRARAGFSDTRLKHKSPRRLTL